MTGRLRDVTGHRVESLSAGWEVAACSPGLVTDPAGLDSQRLEWIAASVPCTAASALRAAGRWSLDGAVRRFDAEDWWFRTTFATSPPAAGESIWLRFDGIATLAEVWLNGTRILGSDSMFVAHAIRVDGRLAARNELVIRCRALDEALREARPRPRWRVPMAEHQQLRWFRTTLLGRTPGWSPPAAPVGPWRAVRLERRRGLVVRDVRIATTAEGRIRASLRAEPLDGDAVADARLMLRRGDRVHRVALVAAAEGRFDADGVVPDAERWWPHTHGSPALYDVTAEFRREGGTITADLGRVGFRTIAVERDGDEFRFVVNAVPVFARGACWTPLDAVTLDAEAAQVDSALDQAVRCGMNLLRVSGTMAYESDRFLDGCDERGILLWQDLMFANFDYPTDAAFTDLVDAEVRGVTARLQGRACVAVVCGNSEGEQQAAMWGVPREEWAAPLFHQRIARLVSEALPDACYWPSSAHGGPFPHHASAGTTAFYAVGGYRRAIEDARRADVRFASECLAFANVPSPESLARIPGASPARVRGEGWRTRAPRDLGAGWDFDDVRDHYFQLLFGLDPRVVCETDPAHYLELSRVVTGEVMSAAFVEWRRAASRTRGALVWYLRDLWHGAGWGVVDAGGGPKAAWHYLRRAMAPILVGITDEGTNGLDIHLVNDSASPIDGRLRLAAHRADGVRVADGDREVRLAPRDAVTINAVALCEGFRDLSYAYRFGGPECAFTTVVLEDGHGAVLARAKHCVGSLPSAPDADLGLEARWRRGTDGTPLLVVRSRRFAFAVQCRMPGYDAEDDFFHLAPGEVREVRLCAQPGCTTSPAGEVRALNAPAPVEVRPA